MSCFISKLFHFKAIETRTQQYVCFWNRGVIFMVAITNKEMANAITVTLNNRKLRSMQSKTQRDATQLFLQHTTCSPVSVYTCQLRFQVQANWRNNTGQFFPPSKPFLGVNLSSGPLGWVQLSRLHCFSLNCSRCWRKKKLGIKFSLNWVYEQNKHKRTHRRLCILHTLKHKKKNAPLFPQQRTHRWLMFALRRSFCSCLKHLFAPRSCRWGK